MSEYILPHNLTGERQRLALMSQLLDPLESGHITEDGFAQIDNHYRDPHYWTSVKDRWVNGCRFLLTPAFADRINLAHGQCSNCVRS